MVIKKVGDIEYQRRGSLREKVVAGLSKIRMGPIILESYRKRHQLKVALVRSWSATGGVRKFKSELRCFAQEPSQKRLNLPPLVVRSSDGRGIVSAGRTLVAEASGRYVREAPEAHLLPPHIIILTRGHRFVTENLYGDEEAGLRHGMFGAFFRSFSPVEDRLGAVFSLLGPYSHNYFHWLMSGISAYETDLTA